MSGTTEPCCPVCDTLLQLDVQSQRYGHISVLDFDMRDTDHPTSQSQLTLEQIAARCVDAGYQVHRHLGPGLLETIYERCLELELSERGLFVERQVEVPVVYKGRTLGTGYRADFIVNSNVVVEVKSVQELLPVHQAQVITYLKLTGCHVGFLMNFNATLFKQGVRRIVV